VRSNFGFRNKGCFFVNLTRKLSHVLVADVQAFKAGLHKQLNQMLRELWGPYLSRPAVPVANLILDSALN
jgi:hypothetical protein